MNSNNVGRYIDTKISNNFSLEHLRRFASVYNTLIVHYSESFYAIALYNDFGKIILHRSNSTKHAQIAGLDLIYKEIDLNRGFTKEQMIGINDSYQYIRRNHCQQVKSEIIYTETFATAAIRMQAQWNTGG